MQGKPHNLISKQYNSLDLVKFLMAFAVVAVHTEPFINCTNNILIKVISPITSMAVPFYFLASGYLLAVKMRWPYANNTDNANRLLKQTKKLLKCILHGQLYICL